MLRVQPVAGRLSGYLCPDKDIFSFCRTTFIEVVEASVICFELLRCFSTCLSHETHHVASGHLGIYAFLNDLAIFQFSEHTGDKLILGS